jgi:hypothetical protein
MEYSRKICVEAALELLKHHSSIFEATRGGGPLSSSRWFMTSLNAHDFLLAAMVLCMELNLIERSSSISAGPGNLDVPKIEEIKQRLRRSYEIYRLPVRHFAPTGKARKAMELMLAKTESLQDSHPAFQPDGTETNVMGGNLEPDLTQPLGFLSINPIVSQATVPPVNNICEDPMGGMFDVSQGLDWVCRILFVGYIH